MAFIIILCITLQSRFYCQAVQRYYAGPITPKIHLTRLFRLSFHQSKENISQSRFVYKCIDCSFSVRKMYFIPIVYLIIDHFLDCKEHLVIENIRKVFLEERFVLILLFIIIGFHGS
ncbi:unnamed protein product [Meloidogyne enterolobii]|uniref:Uncharacterized protein n=1 Tax=Meloidogyne enterolobii TaxID=390850 RepID=A0ACB1B4U8_MELEN